LDGEDLEGFALDGEVFGVVPGAAADAVAEEDEVGEVVSMPDLSFAGVAGPVAVGEAKESRPGPWSRAASVGGGDDADAWSGVVRLTAIAVTQATTVAIASVPASQSLRVPGAREVSGTQPFSQEGCGGGLGVVSGMRFSSSGAKAAAAGSVRGRWVKCEAMMDHRGAHSSGVVWPRAAVSASGFYEN
jgi:hypothetical protein